MASRLFFRVVSHFGFVRCVAGVKNDPRSYTKPHELDFSLRVSSWIVLAWRGSLKIRQFLCDLNVANHLSLITQRIDSILARRAHRGIQRADRTTNQAN